MKSKKNKASKEQQGNGVLGGVKRFTIEEVKDIFFDAIQIGNGYIEDTHYPDVDIDIAEREWQDYIKDNNIC
jgi:hypothetical protein